MALPTRYNSAFFSALDPRAIEQVFLDLEVYRAAWSALRGPAQSVPRELHRSSLANVRHDVRARVRRRGYGVRGLREDPARARDGGRHDPSGGELEAGTAARELMAFLMSSSLSRFSKWTQVAPLTQLDDAWIRMSPPMARAVAWVKRRRRLPMSLKPVEPLTGPAAEVARDLMQTASAPPSRT
jgi:hypothetical protein